MCSTFAHRIWRSEAISLHNASSECFVLQGGEHVRHALLSTLQAKGCLLNAQALA